MSWDTKIPARLIDFANRVLPNNNTIIGVKMIATGGGSGTWVYIDEYDNVVEIDKQLYFKEHPTYSGIKTVQMDGNQIMVQIPKFYIRTEGGKKFWIAPNPYDDNLSDEENQKNIEALKAKGFRLHTAFYKKSGEENNHFSVGAYQATLYNGKCCSEPGLFPKANMPFNEWLEACNGRNSINGVSGFHMWTIYEVSAITILALIECCSTDFQTHYGQGRVDTTGMGLTSHESVISATYRGITGLWGNAWQYVDGLFTDGSDTICIWSNDGKRIKKTTTVKVCTKDAENKTWSDGISSGYFTSLSTEVGREYNLNDIFLPNFKSITNGYRNGNFADRIFGRTSDGVMKVCCVGGDFASEPKDAGIFAYNFDVSPTEAFDNITTRLATY